MKDNTLKDLVIYGAGGLGREVLSLIRRDYANVWKVIGFIDDAQNLPKTVDGLRVYKKDFLASRSLAVVIAIGDPLTKTHVYGDLLQNKNLTFPNIISSKAYIDINAQIGIGNIITDFCWISTNTIIENCVLVNVATTVGHDAQIGSYTSIMPQCAISGHVEVGRATLIGAKSFILQGKHIGQNAVIAAGSCVFRNVDNYETVWGNPAHTLVKDHRK